MADRRPTVVFFDDLQWVDEATLELLPSLAASVETGRSSSSRRTAATTSRARIRSVACAPSFAARAAGGARARAARTRSSQPSWPRGSSSGGQGRASCSGSSSGREGVPFLVEELAAALAGGGAPRGARPTRSSSRWVMTCLCRTPCARPCSYAPTGSPRRPVARSRWPSVAGERVDLGLVADLAGAQGLEEAIELRFLVEVDDGVAAFRHALVREAIYRTSRGRGGEYITAGSPRHSSERARRRSSSGSTGSPRREPERARPKLLAAAEAFCAVHAYRDASRLGRRALELWPAGEDEAGRLVALERLGLCAELCGELVEAARVWEEVADARRADGESEGARRDGAASRDGL